MSDTPTEFTLPTKRCAICREIKELLDFYKNKRMKDGLCTICKECSHTKGVLSNIKNREKNLARTRQNWIKNEPERIKKKEKREARKKKLLEEAILSITKKCDTCEIVKDKNEFYIKRNAADGLNPDCKSCIAIRNSINHSRNREKRLEKGRIWNINHKEEKAISDAKYYESHKKERLSYSKNYRKQKKGKINALVMKRKAAKKSATPLWLTKKQLLDMEKFYDESERLTKESGILHQVDHIVPLQGKNVRGLHVPWNLQILTKDKNNNKRNKLLQKDVDSHKEFVMDIINKKTP